MGVFASVTNLFSNSEEFKSSNENSSKVLEALNSLGSNIDEFEEIMDKWSSNNQLFILLAVLDEYIKVLRESKDELSLSVAETLQKLSNCIRKIPSKEG